MKFNKKLSLISLLLALAVFCGLFTSCDIDDISNAIDIADSIYNELSNIAAETDDTQPSPESSAATDTEADQTTEKQSTTAKADITTKTPAVTTKTPAETSKPAETTKKVTTTSKPAETTAPEKIDVNGVYTSKEDVALYIHTYGKLPSNFITKADAQKAGWSGSGSDALDNYAGTKNKCIGGDTFGNYEGVLPKKSGRTWKECDIDTLHAKQRGVKRIVFSNDGLIYYTEDHYTTFTLLYGGS